jgi:hypothetical protein
MLSLVCVMQCTWAPPPHINLIGVHSPFGGTYCSQRMPTNIEVPVAWHSFQFLAARCGLFAVQWHPTGGQIHGCARPRPA